MKNRIYLKRGGGDPRHVHRGSGGPGPEDEGRRPGRAGDGLNPK